MKSVVREQIIIKVCVLAVGCLTWVFAGPTPAISVLVVLEALGLAIVVLGAEKIKE